MDPGALKQMIWSPGAQKFSSWSPRALHFLARSPGALNPFGTLKREAQSTRSFDFVGISLLKKTLIPKRNPTPVLFSAMAIRAVYRSSTVLKTPAIFVFTRHSRQIQTSRHSDRVEVFDWLSVGAFVYQPIRMLSFVSYLFLH